LKLREGEGVWLTRAKIENCGGVSSIELNLRHRLTVLVGDNGAGKTTVLNAIAVVTGSAPPDTYLYAFARPRRVGGAIAGYTNIEVVIDGRTSRLRFYGPDGYGAEGTVTPSGIPSVVTALYGSPRDANTSFETLVTWFRDRDIEEARSIRDKGDLSYRLPDLESVRHRVSAMIAGTTKLRFDAKTDELVTDQLVAQRWETFRVTELAGGIKGTLVLVADLATRLTQAPAETARHAIVLIDEIDLHLHPKWQLRVVQDLLNAFPEAQFIVTTHSEEIIASVPSECVIALEPDGEGNVVARSIPPVQGAKFDRVLKDAMDLPAERPPEVQEKLDAYWQLIDEGQGETQEALVLRRELDELFQGTEPELVRADLAIKRIRARQATAS